MTEAAVQTFSAEVTEPSKRNHRIQQAMKSAMLVTVGVLGALAAVWQFESPLNNHIEVDSPVPISVKNDLGVTERSDHAVLVARFDRLEAALAKLEKPKLRYPPPDALDSRVAGEAEASVVMEVADERTSHRWFEDSVTQHRTAAIEGDWAATMTATVKTLVADSVPSKHVNLSYLDCRAMSCELHFELTEQRPRHVETLMLGALGRVLPEQQVRREGQRLTIIAAQSS